LVPLLVWVFSEKVARRKGSVKPGQGNTNRHQRERIGSGTAGEVIEELHDGGSVGIDQHGAKSTAAVDCVEEYVNLNHVLLRGLAAGPPGGEVLKGSLVAACEKVSVLILLAP
jgi:hypothetical protein